MFKAESQGQIALREACVPPPPRMSAKDLARKMNVTRQAISMWVRGTRKPTAAQRKKLQRLLAIPESAWDAMLEPAKKAA